MQGVSITHRMTLLARARRLCPPPAAVSKPPSYLTCVGEHGDPHVRSMLHSQAYNVTLNTMTSYSTLYRTLLIHERLVAKKRGGVTPVSSKSTLLANLGSPLCWSLLPSTITVMSSLGG